MEEDMYDIFGAAGKHFHQVIALHESSHLTWEEVTSMAPLLPRGWFELAALPVEYRVEFTCDYWLSCLPFTSQKSGRLEKKLGEFFDSVEEIGVFATQSKKGEAFEVHMVYSLKENAGFFQGGPPATPEAIETLIKRFESITFPTDYLAFLRIHDGFSKYTDTGILKSRDVTQVYQKLQHQLAEELLVRPDGETIDPSRLVPFYESFGLHCYQCFYADWYPEGQIGNVYFSEHERFMSNFLDRNRLEENLAFPSFLDWLIFYLEDIYNL